MDSAHQLVEKSRIKDVQWLCFLLSESELDLVISSKKLAIQHAKVIGHVELGERFDLKILRELGLVVMEHFRGKVKHLPPLSGMDKSTTAFIDGYNLLKCKLGDVH